MENNEKEEEKKRKGNEMSRDGDPRGVGGREGGGGEVAGAPREDIFSGDGGCPSLSLSPSSSPLPPARTADIFLSFLSLACSSISSVGRLVVLSFSFFLSLVYSSMFFFLRFRFIIIIFLYFHINNKILIKLCVKT